MNKIMITVILVNILLCCLYLLRSDSLPDDIEDHLSTLTPYRFRFNKNDSKITYPGCKDVKIWMLVRHGTRYPKKSEITKRNEYLESLRLKIVSQHQQGYGSISQSQIQLFKEWQSGISLEAELRLTDEGKDEMILLAERMQNRFPNTILQQYNSNSFLFRHTPTVRTQQSARHFSIGLFDKKDSQNVKFHPVTVPDLVLRSYKYCDRWQKLVKENPNATIEKHLFGISHEMNNTLELIAKKLGLEQLSLADAVLIYKSCGYDTSWYKHKLSPWCFAFDNATIQYLEYYKDLQHYWVDGYGHNLTQEQSCLTMKNIFEIFDNKTGPQASFMFAHSGTILKFMTYLQLYKPSAPLRSVFMDPRRSWRTSVIDSFAANLAFVLFDCTDGQKMLTLHQERIIKLPMCNDELCPWEILKDYFRESVNNCNFTEMCELHTANA